jgi:hypothetical protein
MLIKEEKQKNEYDPEIDDLSRDKYDNQYVQRTPL